MGEEGEYLLLGLGCLETEYSAATHETESRPYCLICENLAIALICFFLFNWPDPSSLKPLFQGEAKCEGMM